MAARFLASHGVDVNAIMSNIQFGIEGNTQDVGKDEMAFKSVSRILKARLPRKPVDTLWDIDIKDGIVLTVSEHSNASQSPTQTSHSLNAQGGLLAPSLCHAHVHLDKCFLLQDDKFKDLEIKKGDFDEAMQLTGEAKSRFEEDDLLRRGSRLIAESVEAGVTVMRAFVEVDEVVGLKCVEAGVKLKKKFNDVCDIQICAFAQLALFTGEDGGEERRRLLEEALALPEVDVIGSTPYVEGKQDDMKRNVDYTIQKSLALGKHLDFHLDYNLDPTTTPLVWYVLAELKKQSWQQNASAKATICLGHCSRLTLFDSNEWSRLRLAIDTLPITFVGLPTSDIFMMGRPDEDELCSSSRVRGTMQIPEMIAKHKLNGAFSINNIGNSFTPQGNCDPLSVASLAVGVYQAGTKQDTELLYVSANLTTVRQRLMAFRIVFLSVPREQLDVINRLGLIWTSVQPQTLYSLARQRRRERLVNHYRRLSTMPAISGRPSYVGDLSTTQH